MNVSNLTKTKQTITPCAPKIEWTVVNDIYKIILCSWQAVYTAFIVYIACLRFMYSTRTIPSMWHISLFSAFLLNDLGSCDCFCMVPIQQPADWLHFTRLICQTFFASGFRYWSYLIFFMQKKYLTICWSGFSICFETDGDF